jgi:hypothetical protein
MAKTYSKRTGEGEGLNYRVRKSAFFFASNFIQNKPHHTLLDMYTCGVSNPPVFPPPPLHVTCDMPWQLR